MSSFKYKPDKLKFINNVNTLDESHKKKVNEFTLKKSLLPNKIQQKEALESQLKELNNLLKQNDNLIPDENYVPEVDLIKKRSNIKSQIQTLDREIELIKSGKEELDYYSKTNSILMEYYNILDNDNDSFEHDLDSKSPSSNKDISSHNKKVEDDIITESSMDILEKLNKESQKNRKEKKITRKRNITPATGSENILSFFNQMDDSGSDTVNERPEKKEKTIETVVSNRASLYDEYLSILDSGYVSNKIKPNPIKICSTCNIEKQLIQSEGHYVCKKCGEIEHVIIESEVPSHKENTNEKQHSAYKRQNHLSEWLNQFQGKETTEIDEAIFVEINKELTKMKVLNLASYPYPKAKKLIREILKKIRQNDYYEHIPYIISKITNKPPPTIIRETEEKIKKMFRDTQEPFNRHKPEDRVNYLNYAYALHKFFQLLGQEEIADSFPLLKDREKLRKQDEIWKKICKDLNWKFYPSI